MLLGYDARWVLGEKGLYKLATPGNYEYIFVCEPIRGKIRTIEVTYPFGIRKVYGVSNPVNVKSFEICWECANRLFRSTVLSDSIIVNAVINWNKTGRFCELCYATLAPEYTE